jgi:hypothetical protein
MAARIAAIGSRGSVYLKFLFWRSSKMPRGTNRVNTGKP